MIIAVQGQQLQVPDGLTQAQIGEVVDHFASTQIPAAQQNNAPSGSPGTPPPVAGNPPTPEQPFNSGDAAKMAQNVAQGATFGQSDDIGAAVATLPVWAMKNILPQGAGGETGGAGFGGGPTLGQTSDAIQGMKGQSMTALQQWNQANPVKGFVSQMAGGIPMMAGAAALGGAALPGAASALQAFSTSRPLLAAAAGGAAAGGLYSAGEAPPGDTLKAGVAGAVGGALTGPVFKLAGDYLGNNIIAPAIGALKGAAESTGSALQDFLKLNEPTPTETLQPSPTLGFSNITNEPLGGTAPDPAAPVTGKLPLSPGVANKDTNLLRIEENAKQGLLGPDMQNQMAESNANVVKAARGAMQTLKGVTNQDSDSLLSSAVSDFQNQAQLVKASAQALYTKRDNLMADAIINRPLASKTLGKDMFGVLTDPSNIAGFKSNSGAAAKGLYSDFRDLMKGTPDSTPDPGSMGGTVSTTLPPDHQDAPYMPPSGPQGPKAPTGYKSPLLTWIKQQGGVLPGTDVDDALKNLDFAPGRKGTPVGLFKNDAGGDIRSTGKFAKLDGIPVSEFNDRFGTEYPETDDGYMHPQNIADAIRNEAFGGKSENPHGLDEQFNSAKDEVFNRAKQMGAGGLTNGDVDAMATHIASNPDANLDDVINSHMQDKYFSEQQPGGIKTFAAKDALPFNSLAAWRQDAAHLAQTDESTSGHLAKKMIAAYENWMDNVPQNAFLSGDPQVANAARDAGKAWKNYKSLFGSENSPVISGMVKPYDATPADFVDKVFGANIAGNGNTALNMRKMVNALPADGQQPFKEKVFSGLISRAFEGAGDADQLSLGKLRNNLSALQNSAVYKEHFAGDTAKDTIITNLVKDLSQHITQTGRKDITSPSGGNTGRIIQAVGLLAKVGVPEVGSIQKGMINAQQFSADQADRAALKAAMSSAAKTAHSAARSGPVFDINSLKAGLIGGIGAANMVQQNNGGTK